MENKTVSLDDLYNQVQEMLTAAGIGTCTLMVEAKVHGYQHEKEGKHSVPNMKPKKEIRVYISYNNDVLISSNHESVEGLIAAVTEAINKKIKKVMIETITIEP